MSDHLQLHIETCNDLRRGGRPTTRKSLGEKEQEYLDALRVRLTPIAAWKLLGSLAPSV